MFSNYDTFEARTREVLRRIAEACGRAGRSAGEVQLLAVTKTQPPEAVEYVARFGLTAVGENRVQEAVEKQRSGTVPIRWELIGHLQSNKVRVAVDHFHRIQSVDQPKLALLLERVAAERGRILPVLLEVNAGEDPAKFGVTPAEAPRLLEAALAQPHLQVDGLMTVAPLADDPAVARRTFARLRELRERLATQFGVPLRELSMGMTGDLEAAVAEGSTLVRVGTALFGARD